MTRVALCLVAAGVLLAVRQAATGSAPTPPPEQVTEVLLVLMQKCWPGMDVTATRELYRHHPGTAYDLNEDGQMEYICEPDRYIAAGQTNFTHGATGNGSVWVLGVVTGQWTNLGEVSGKNWRVMPRRINGWHVIENYWDSGTVNFISEYEFHGGRYRKGKTRQSTETSG